MPSSKHSKHSKRPKRETEETEETQEVQEVQGDFCGAVGAVCGAIGAVGSEPDSSDLKPKRTIVKKITVKDVDVWIRQHENTMKKAKKRIDTDQDPEDLAQKIYDLAGKHLAEIRKEFGREEGQGEQEEKTEE